MKLQEFKAQVPHPLRVVTLVLICRKGKVLLAVKARDFGEGMWNAPGGKLKEGETPFSAAGRETEEELGIRPTSLKLVAKLNFYFGCVPLEQDWNQQVQVFLSPGYYGGKHTKPTSSGEMHSPTWFPFDELPVDQMWPFDRLWMPRVLNGAEGLEADFFFGANNQPLEHTLPEAA